MLSDIGGTKGCAFRYLRRETHFQVFSGRDALSYWCEETGFQILAGRDVLSDAGGKRRAFILAGKDALSDTGGKEQIRWAAGIPRDVPSTLKTRRNFSSF